MHLDDLTLGQAIVIASIKEPPQEEADDYPTFFMFGEPWQQPRRRKRKKNMIVENNDLPIDGIPLTVRGINLPFLVVKKLDEEGQRIIDSRKYNFVKVQTSYFMEVQESVNCSIVEKLSAENPRSDFISTAGGVIKVDTVHTCPVCREGTFVQKMRKSIPIFECKVCKAICSRQLSDK